jgi:hypothetical protein
MRFKIILAVITALSASLLIIGLVFIMEPKISNLHRITFTIFIQLGGAFFFALTAGYISEKIKNVRGYSGLWLFSEEFRKSGVLNFYSDRYGNAEESLKEAFNKHRKGEVLMVGVSLRAFLVEGNPYHSSVKRMLERKGVSQITVKALICNPEGNCELPLRSFIEEFNQDKSFPKSKSVKWNWEKKIDFSFSDFEKSFFDEHGINAQPGDRSRAVNDSLSTRIGVAALKGNATAAGHFIEHREFNSAPYCTLIIFPEKAFYTPNILYTDSPANLPTIIFHKSSDVYKKLLTHFKFLWWVSNPESYFKDG